MKLQIASLLASHKSEIPLKYVDVQMQSGTNDCGLLAIAYATALCLGELRGKYIIEQTATRAHLIKCLETGVSLMFPMRKTRRTSRRVKSTATIKVCCDCRIPTRSSSDRVLCTNCRKQGRPLEFFQGGARKKKEICMYLAAKSGQAEPVLAAKNSPAGLVIYMSFTMQSWRNAACTATYGGAN